MRKRLLATLLAWSLIGWSGYAAAQDEEEEEGDVDALMQSDPEREAEEEEEEAEEEASEEENERPPPGEQQGDDERPPGEEPVAVEKKEGPPPEPDSGPVNKFSVGVLVGYGISLEDANPWGFGFGARAGYNFGGFHVGGRVAVQLGGDYESPRADNTGGGYFITESWSLWEIGPEVGYDIFVDSIDIRPYIGLGLAIVSRDEEDLPFNPGSSEADGHPFLAPGVSLLFNASDSFFLGVDARLQVIFRSLAEVKGLPLNLYIGMRL